MQPSARPRPYMRVKRLKRWMSDLPTANIQRTARQYLHQLQTLNNANYPAHERAALMDSLRPLAQQLTLNLSQSLQQTNGSLQRRDKERFETLQQLLAEMATGYKLVVNELAQTSAHKEHNDMLLREAIYFSIQYLARRLLEAYLVYTPEPRHVWLELHQLYQYAREKAIQNLPVDDPFPEFSLPTQYCIDLLYKRIVLLSLAEPYHLMHGEAREFYYLVSAWTGACHFLPLVANPVDGEFAVDMRADAAPRFVSSDLDWKAEDGHIIDITEVKKRLDVHLQRILRASMVELEEDHQSLLQHRRQRDMLLRLADAWHGVLKRMSERQTGETGVRLAAGLNASHHYLSLGKAFTPEIDELKLNSGEVEAAIFASAYRTALKKDRYHLNRDYRVNPWWQRNYSRSGAALSCTTDCDAMRTNVGEIIAYNDAEKTAPHWKIGVVRWLKTTEDNGMDIGIMNLADSAVPVAVKAVTGTGKGTDYFRSLLIPKQVSLQQTRSIIAPATLYDINTTLAVNMKHKMFYVRLIKLLLATKTFSQFEFEVMEAPPADAEGLFFL